MKVDIKKEVKIKEAVITLEGWEVQELLAEITYIHMFVTSRYIPKLIDLNGQLRDKTS